MLALYIILGIIALIVLLLSVKVRIEAEYFDSFKLRLRWLFLHFDIYPMQKKEKKPKKEKPQKEKPPEEPQTEKKPNPFKTFYENQGFDGVKQLVRDSADAVGSMMKSVKKHLIIDELFLWVIVSHNHDAAKTAIEYGETCQDVFPAMGFICSNLNVRKYDVEIEPDFIGTFSSAQFSAAISIRPLFLINAGIVLVFRLLFKVVLKIFKAKPKEPQSNTETQNLQGGATQ